MSKAMKDSNLGHILHYETQEKAVFCAAREYKYLGFVILKQMHYAELRTVLQRKKMAKL